MSCSRASGSAATAASTGAWLVRNVHERGVISTLLLLPHTETSFRPGSADVAAAVGKDDLEADLIRTRRRNEPQLHEGEPWVREVLVQLGDDVVGHQLGDAQHLPPVVRPGDAESELSLGVETIYQTGSNFSPPRPARSPFLEQRHRSTPWRFAAH